VGDTKIEWTDYTFNPWWGCQRVSPGCEHCYAETFAHRLALDIWGPTNDRRLFDDHHWGQPYVWARRRAKGDPRHKVFCASMSDVFEDRRDLDAQRARLWPLIEDTPALTYQLLTKRPENTDKLVPASWVLKGWPRNVWAMTSAEDQRRADERIPRLMVIPAAIHGVSLEPLLGPIALRALVRKESDRRIDALAPHPEGLPRRWLDWVIVGGESGPGARPCDITWVRLIVRQCREAGVPVFVKQLGSRPVAGEYRMTSFRHPKGGDPKEWPKDLRVREMPWETQP
jgi:protein gp37